jgi:competence protein ComEA
VHFTTARRDRDTQVGDRLALLALRAGADQADRVDELPADQEWIDASLPDPARPEPSAGPWWRGGSPGRLVERWLPGGVLPGRRRLPIVLLVVLVVGVAVAGGVVLSSGAAPEPPPDLPAARASPGPEPSTPGGSIVVSVVGRVVRPGLVTLAEGARVADALRAAGGPEPGVDVSGLNIARRVGDGEQIAVGVPVPPAAAPGPAAGIPGKIDLNAASAAQLDTVPGVGSVTAQRIVDWRTRHGRFTRVEQLREIDGIGPTRFTRLKDLVMVG